MDEIKPVDTEVLVMDYRSWFEKDTCAVVWNTGFVMVMIARDLYDDYLNGPYAGPVGPDYIGWPQEGT